MINTESVTIEKIAGGEIPERANAALSELAKNILDPATKATAPRRLKIEIVVRPTDERDLASVEIGISTKLAAAQPMKTKLFVNQMRNGDVILAEKDVRQHDFDFGVPATPKHLADQRDHHEEETEE